MVILTEWTQTCGACPEQYEGRLDSGEFVYLRHRHGFGYLSVGRSLDEAVGGENELLSWEDTEWDGQLRPGALARILQLAAISDPDHLSSVVIREDGLTFYGVDGKVI